MNVRFVLEASGAASELDETPPAFVARVGEFCDAKPAALTPPAGSCDAADVFASSASCDHLVCRIDRATCVANTLFNITGTVAPYVMKIGTDRIEVPPQDVETNAALAELAYRYAAQAGGLAGNEIRAASGVPALGSRCGHADLFPTPPPAAPTWGEFLARTVVDTLQLADEAAHAAVDFNLAAADSEFSRSPDVRRASKFSWSDGELSRSRAAHILVGGDWDIGIPAYADATRIPEQGLSPAGQRAMQLIHLAAPHPANVADTAVELGVLALGPASSLPVADDPMADRLEELLILDAGELSTLSLPEFLERFGVTATGFAEARLHFAFETLRLSRPTGTSGANAAVVGADMPLAGGGYTTAPRYAATAGKQPPPPPGYFLGEIQGAGSPVDIRGGAPAGGTLLAPVPGALYSNSGLAQTRDTAFFTARVAVRNGSQIPDYVQAELVDLASRSWNIQPYRTELCYDWLGQRADVRVRVQGLADPGKVTFVRGVAGLECALSGAVHGVSCDLALYVVAPSATTTGTDATMAAGVVHYTEYVVPVHQGSDLPVYAVVQGEYEPATMVHANVPGSFQLLGLVVDELIQVVTSGYNFCTLIPKDVELELEVEEITAPSHDEPQESKTSCADVDDSERIALENELASDGDAYESSWRHYLNLARSAAAEADRLGEELILKGLDIDRRSESALEELATICGGPISIEGMLDETLTPSSVLGSSCTTEGADCGGGFTCRNSRCIRDSLAHLKSLEATDPGAGRLLDCLGFEPPVELVALGEGGDVCVWREHAPNNHRLCGVPAAEHSADFYPQCPWVRQGSTCSLPASAGALGVLPSTHEPVAVTAGLRIVERALASSSDGPAPAPCDLLRRLRGGDREAIDAILEQESFLRAGTIRDVARLVGIKIKPLDYLAVTYAGRERLSTGSPITNPATSGGWPCGGPFEPGLESSDSGCALDHARFGPSGGYESRESLLCSFLTTESCDAPATQSLTHEHRRRVRMNHRLVRALYALRAVTETGMEGFEVPYVHNGSPEGVSVRDGAWSALGTSEYRSVWHSGGQRSMHEWAGTTSFGSSFRGRSGWCDNEYGDPVPVLWTAFHGTDTFLPVRAFCGFGGNDGNAAGHPLVILNWNEAGADGTGEASPRVDNFWRGFGAMDRRTFGIIPRGLNSGFRFPPLVDQYPDEAVRWNSNAFRGNVEGLRPQTDCPVRTVYLGLTAYQEVDKDCLRMTTIGWGEVLDGMELACAAYRSGGSGSTCAQEIPVPNDVTDLPKVKRFLECVAGELEEAATRQVLSMVPAEVVRSFQVGIDAQAYSGTRGAAVADVVAGVRSLEKVPREVASHLRGLANELRQLDESLQILDNNRSIADEQFRSTAMSQATACASASASVSDGGILGISGGVANAAIVCANAGFQIAVASNLRNLSRENLEAEQATKFLEIQASVDRRATRLGDLSTELNADLARLRGGLAALESQRQRARQLLGQALFETTDASGEQAAVNTVMRRSYSTAAVRYERARRHAVKMAHLARRAVEQRLGLDLRDYHEPMSLVEAPGSWADQLCSLPAIDYSRLRDGSSLLDGFATGPDHYADAYIGEYVARLERVVESYRLDHPFQDGAGTMVVSLKNDVSRVRRECEVASINLLGRAAQLGELQLAEDEVFYEPGVWRVAGCDASDGSARGCVSVRELESAAIANLASNLRPETGFAAGFEVTFGEAPGTDFMPEARVVQQIDLEPGWHIVSWFAKHVAGSPLAAADAVQVRVPVTVAGEQTGWEALAPVSPGLLPPLACVDQRCEWDRHFFLFRLPDASVVEVGVFPDAVYRTPPFPAIAAHAVRVGGLMVENVSDRLDPATGEPSMTLLPRDFVATSDPGLTRARACEDTTGAGFQELWSYRCEALCAEGIGASCEGSATTRCFWEYQFPINDGLVDAGETFARAGFAYGNYNYRLDRVGLNFVGTEVLSCDDSPFPSSCYASATIPFSIRHEGPFWVRPRDRSLPPYEAPLFIGRVEHGRGLAAERYLGVPLSSTDRGLIDGFMHRELRGRPLSGNYAIRIWDTGDVDFGAIEDVQVVMEYRYWTREGE